MYGNLNFEYILSVYDVHWTSTMLSLYIEALYFAYIEFLFKQKISQLNSKDNSKMIVQSPIVWTVFISFNSRLTYNNNHKRQDKYLTSCYYTGHLFHKTIN